MTKYATYLLTTLVCTMTFFSFLPNAHAETNVYGFKFERLNSDTALPLDQFKGKVLLVVNTASKCGFTDQYKGLEALYNDYKDQGLVVLGVPSGDFAGQEFESEEEIASFCELNYGVSFPMTNKVHVKGDEAHPLYKAAAERFGALGAPKWNFHKYLVDRNGNLTESYGSMTKPDSKKLKKAIEKALEEDAQ